MVSPAVIAMIWGTISTIVLHISKAMERQGIEIFDQIRARVKKEKSNEENEEVEVKKPVVYIVGLIMNNIVPVFAIASNAMVGKEYASYFTSMFGIGLIALLIYSSKILKEKIKKIQIFGAIVLISGTLLIGLENIMRGENNAEVDTTTAVIMMLAFLIGGFIVVLITHFKNPSVGAIGVIFGLYAGGSGGLDPVLKAFGQDNALLPSDLIGWLIFGISFLAGSAGFLITQWGFAKRAQASVLVPAYNSLYVVLPILVFGITLPGFTITYITIISLAMIVAGMVLMKAFTEEEPPHVVDVEVE